MKRLQLPYGVQDYLPEELYNKNRIEEKIQSVFLAHGFDAVQTSSLEFYDIFSSVLNSESINRMFKMTDNDGSLLVLRPDPTLQICRIVATKFDYTQINKLFYISNSFEYLPNKTTARNREFEQIGLEMTGKTGEEGDLEIVTLAIESMLATGLDDFLLEIGNVNFMKGLMQEGGINESDSKKLNLLVSNKDMLGVELLLQDYKVSSKFLTNFLLLPTLFGGEEVLLKAKEIYSNKQSLLAIENLLYIMNGLKERGLEKYVTVDLGMVSGQYYTGLVIKGVATSFGISLLDGGRYDTLGNSFNAPMEAVGFAVGIKRLLMALDNQQKLIKLPSCEYAYIADGVSGKFEYETVAALRKSGKRVSKLFCKTIKELEEYSEKNGIENTFTIFNNSISNVKGEPVV